MKLPLYGKFLFPLLASGLLLGAGAAHAAVYSGVQNIPIPTSFNGVYLDLAVQNGDPNEPSNISGDADGQVDSGFAVGYNEPADWDVNFFFGGIGIAYSPTFNPFVENPTDNGSQILNVAVDTVIGGTEAAARAADLGVNGYGGSGTPSNSDPDSLFSSTSLGSPYSAFTSGTPGYIAFTLETTSGTQYGWMEVTLDGDGPDINGPTGTIHRWAYSDDPNFEVGQIPEPSSLILLLLGSLGLLRRRRDC